MTISTPDKIQSGIPAKIPEFNKYTAPLRVPPNNLQLPRVQRSTCIQQNTQQILFSVIDN